MVYANAYDLSNRENKIYKTITAEIYYKMNEPSKGTKVINETFGEDLSSHPQALVALALCYSKRR